MHKIKSDRHIDVIVSGLMLQRINITQFAANAALGQARRLSPLQTVTRDDYANIAACARPSVATPREAQERRIKKTVTFRRKYKWNSRLRMMIASRCPVSCCCCRSLVVVGALQSGKSSPLHRPHMWSVGIAHRTDYSTAWCDSAACVDW